MNIDWQHTTQQYLSKFDKVFVACSGGADSTALLHSLIQLKFNPIVLHCNFQLRGDESDEDERFLINQCKKLGLTIKIKHFNTKNEIEKRGGSTQEVARNLRYEWFSEILEENSNAIICTAHHKNDNIEQLLMAAISSGKTSDLLGIPQSRKGFYRPFLNLDKQSIVNYLNAQKITWCEDSSNSKNDYTRNKIRNQLLPLIEKIDPRANSALANLQEELNVLYSEIDAETTAFLKQQADEKAFLMPFSFWNTKLSLWKLRFIQNLTEKSIRYAVLKQLLNAENGKSFTFGKTTVIKEKTGLFFTKNKEKNQFYKPISEGQTIETPLGKISCTLVAEPIQKKKNCIYINPTDICGELHIRTIKNGDKFIPFGKQNSEKVSNLLIDAKIDNHLKNKQLLICDDEKIIWLVGIRFSEEFKVAKNVKEKIKFQFFPLEKQPNS